MCKMKDLAIQDIEVGDWGQCRFCGSNILFSNEYGYDCTNTECKGHCQTKIEAEVLEDALNGRR